MDCIELKGRLLESAEGVEQAGAPDHLLHDDVQVEHLINDAIFQSSHADGSDELSEDDLYAIQVRLSLALLQKQRDALPHWENIRRNCERMRDKLVTELWSHMKNIERPLPHIQGCRCESCSNRSRIVYVREAAQTSGQGA